MLPISGSLDGPGGRGASPAVVLADVITMTIARIMHTTATTSEINGKTVNISMSTVVRLRLHARAATFIVLASFLHGHFHPCTCRLLQCRVDWTCMLVGKSCMYHLFTEVSLCSLFFFWSGCTRESRNSNGGGTQQVHLDIF